MPKAATFLFAARAAGANGGVGAGTVMTTIITTITTRTRAGSG